MIIASDLTLVSAYYKKEGRKMKENKNRRKNKKSNIKSFVDVSPGWQRLLNTESETDLQSETDPLF